MTKFERMQDAFEAYASENGDGFSDRDYVGAAGYRAEGYALAEEAADMPEEDRADWVDDQAYMFPASARYLVAVAADYRLSVLAKPERKDWFGMASSIADPDAYPFNAEAF